MKNLVLALLVSMIAGCAGVYEPVPKGYGGATAEISDSYTNLRSTSAHYFILDKIDDKDVAQSWGQTRQANYGQGFRFTPSMVTRKVLPERQKLTLKGLVFFPTDAQALFGNDMSVDRDIIFTPKAGEKYTVKGTLGKTGSKVWLEDSAGKVVGGDEGS